MTTPSLPDAGRPFWALRRALCSRSAHVSAGRAGASLCRSDALILRFETELQDLMHNYAGRPTPLYFAKRLSETLKGAQIWLKREDLLHTGAHKINNCLGQILIGAAHGQETHYCGDGRRAAWRSDGNGVRTVRIAVRCLHGRRRHATAASKRVSHAAAGCASGGRNKR